MIACLYLFSYPHHPDPLESLKHRGHVTAARLLLPLNLVLLSKLVKFLSEFINIGEVAVQTFEKLNFIMRDKAFHLQRQFKNEEAE